MGDDSLEYLRDLGVRALAYEEVRSEVIGFILENQVKDEMMATDLFIMGFIWLAHHRKETLTDHDILLLLDIESDVLTIPFDDVQVYSLDESQAEHDLSELLMRTYNKLS